jgi:hypothetical protein
MKLNALLNVLIDTQMINICIRGLQRVTRPLDSGKERTQWLR